MTPVLNRDTILKVAELYDMSYDRKKKVFPPGYLDHCHLTNYFGDPEASPYEGDWDKYPGG